jgi:O-antigen/teichoic acid export membrane protein
MIDWAGLAHNALWVLGLAVALAVLTIAYDESRRFRQRLRDRLAAPGFQTGLNVGLTLVCLGLLFSARAWWERVLWALLTASFAAQVIWAGYRALAAKRRRAVD